MPGHTVYNLAKAGHAQLIRALALELALAIRVNGVAPGATSGPKANRYSTCRLRAYPQPNPAAKRANPEDLAKVVAFLLSPAAGM